jgi:anaerobic magnesium-protoporphyrin IX monomethyl ester cyclase
MKVALILPPITLEERYNKAVARMAGTLPPLGLLSIATLLKKEGHEVIVLDGSLFSFNEIMAEVERFSPSVIGITAMTLMWPKVRFLSMELKKKWPDTNIIIGGVHATILKEKALAEMPHIDAVAWGEGEFSMIEYIKSIGKSDRASPIDGIAYRRIDGSIAIGKDRKPIENLDALPIPDRTFVPVAKYVAAFEQYKKLPVTNIITTRGCPFKCIFCLPDLLGKGVRYRSADKVIEEIEYLLCEFGIKDVAFWDDTFTVNKKRVFDICRLIKEKGLKFVWSAQARADCVTPEMLDAMKRAGCWKLFFGVESLVQKNLDALKKGETVEEIFRAIRWTRKAGIESEASFIFGIPGETFEEGMHTISLAQKLDPDYAKFFYLSLWNTGFYEEAKKYGTILSGSEEKFTGNRIMFVPFSMTKEELNKLYYAAYRRFYFRPKTIFRRIKKLGDPVEFRKSINGLRALMAVSAEEAAWGIKSGSAAKKYLREALYD